MTQTTRRLLLAGAGALALALAAAPASAQKKYDEGATDTEIKIGNTNPYSGNASAYGTIGKTIEAYFKMVNEQGGINGRKINFISYDDGYAPPKTVEMVRKLVEEDKVLFVFQTLGTPPNTAIHKYMNAKKVPHLFVATGASKWGNPKEFPWTMGFQPDYVTEAVIYAKHILANVKDPKIGVLMQNDDYGKDYFNGFKQGLGKDADKLIVQLATYEVTDPTVDSQMIQLKNSGANVFFNITTPKFAAQAIRKAAEIGWKPAHYLNNVSASVGIGHEARRLRERPGHHHGALHQGPDRPAVRATTRTSSSGRPSCRSTTPNGNHGRRLQRLWLCGVDPVTRGAEAMRRRPHARERHEAGGEPQGRRSCRWSSTASRPTPARPTSIRSSRCGCRASRARSASSSATSSRPRPQSQ